MGHKEDKGKYCIMSKGTGRAEMIQLVNSEKIKPVALAFNELYLYGGISQSSSRKNFIATYIGSI